MKVFISSVIGGMEKFRDAVAEAIETLQHVAIRAEDFNASPVSPRLACLQEVQNSDAMILMIGERYGDKQQSGLSATHEEYREARRMRMPVIVMVQQNVSREDPQEAFLREVRGWEGGHYTGSFESPNELRTSTIRSLHELGIQQVQGPPDADEIMSRAFKELSQEQNLRLYNRIQQRTWPQNQQQYFQRMSPQGPAIALVLSCGPLINILRPAQIESPDLQNRLREMILQGPRPLFSIDNGAQIHVEGGKLNIVQEGRFARLDEYGTLTYVAVLPQSYFLSIIIEEDVKEETGRFIEFSRCALDYIDDSNRLSHSGIASSLLNATYSDWKTRAQYQQNPNMSAVPLAMSPQQMQPISLSPPTVRRSELAAQREELTEDLIIRLRRIFYP